jgi:DNA-nicking Smr family endonuclease
MGETSVIMDQRDPHSQDPQPSFQELMGDVKRLIHDRVVHRRPRPAPVPVQARRDEARVMEELLCEPRDPEALQPGDILSYHRPGLHRFVPRKLRRGQYSIAAELDLHGMSAAQAQHALAGFIRQATAVGSQCVRIVHGKGNRSSNQGPVLKPLVNRWLRRREEVLAFHSARPVDGGTGAVYVLLKGLRD